MDSWKSSTQINVCAANSSQVLVSLGKKIVLLEVLESKLKEVASTEMAHDVACLDITPIGADPLSSTICAVGLWTDISARILQLPTFEELNVEMLGGGE